MAKRPKNILITAGGTIVKIDDVRHIGNFSRGAFLSQIAEAALLTGHKVFYLHAKTAKKPFDDSFVFDPNRPEKNQFEILAENRKIYQKVRKNLFLREFETVDDYARSLEYLLKKHPVDVVFLGAAVSDYGLKTRQGKISSSDNELKLTLFKYPKIIKFVKQWAKLPLFQIGFKLLSRVNDKTLIETAYKSGLENKSDLTIANDLQKAGGKNREIIIVTPERGAIKMTQPDLAKKILSFVEKRTNATHFKTVAKTDPGFIKKYQKEFKIFASLCRRLYDQKLMTPFFKRSRSSHGSLSLRTDRNSFLITARSSGKKSLQPKDLVLVKKIDWRKKKIFAVSAITQKPSFNAVLSAAVFNRFPKINAIVHTHNLIPLIPITSFPFAPGTLEYAKEPVRLLKKSRIINLKNHGAVAIGKDLSETVNYVIQKSKK